MGVDIVHSPLKSQNDTPPPSAVDKLFHYANFGFYFILNFDIIIFWSEMLNKIED